MIDQCCACTEKKRKKREKTDGVAQEQSNSNNARGSKQSLEQCTERTPFSSEDSEAGHTLLVMDEASVCITF